MYYFKSFFSVQFRDINYIHMYAINQPCVFGRYYRKFIMKIKKMNVMNYFLKIVALKYENVTCI